MALSSRERTEALLAAAQEEMESLAARGVRIEGNGFSSIVLVKGELTEAERAGRRCSPVPMARPCARRCCAWLSAGGFLRARRGRRRVRGCGGGRGGAGGCGF